MEEGRRIRVLIADDEEKINALICHLVDWEVLHMEVVATARDGLEALEKVRQYKPWQKRILRQDTRDFHAFAGSPFCYGCICIWKRL